MSFDDGELMALSSLQHLLFCERQAALIHVENAWIDNALTIDGQHAHRRVDETAPRRERRGDTVILRALWLKSEGLGLIGKADVVEAYRIYDEPDSPIEKNLQATTLDGLPGFWRFFPVEYKRGKPKQHRADEVQLCAQAICLEEMKGVTVPAGALFYGRTKRRHEVVFDQELRSLVEIAAKKMRRLIDSGETPKPEIDARCQGCSFKAICLPDGVGGTEVASHISRMINDHLGETESL